MTMDTCVCLCVCLRVLMTFHVLGVDACIFSNAFFYLENEIIIFF